MTVRLPWGMPIRCFAHDAIGLSIQQLGVFELSVAEVLWRLTNPGELALDVGANVGQMTAVLAWRAGGAGRVLAFEPNDDVRAELTHNVSMWSARPGIAPIEISPMALSDRDGRGALLIPPSYEWNRGIASVVAADSGGPGARRPVELARLDALLASGERVGVMKLDVEGHEAATLAGATSLLATRRVRDVVYEDHHRYPSAVSALLERHGYTVFAIGGGLWGPRIADPAGPPIHADWESPNYVATTDPERVRIRLRPRRWRVLQ
ncbi:MAG TPA: FkbM family methyltransferase [Gemmatimonadaceae bacterium]|nr:FkbM family methyltransferase [Gemmatimonadaceae bacterium]